MKSRYFSYLCAAMFIILCVTVVVIKCCNNSKTEEEKTETKTAPEVKIVLDIPRVNINYYGTANVRVNNIGPDMPGDKYFLSFESLGSKEEKEEVRGCSALKQNTFDTFDLGKDEITPDLSQIRLTAYQSKGLVYSGSYEIASETMVEVGAENSIHLEVVSDWPKTDGSFWFDIQNSGKEDIPENNVYYIEIRSVTAEGNMRDEIRRLTLHEKRKGKQIQHIELGPSDVAQGKLIKLIFRVYTVEKKFEQIIDLKGKVTYN